MLDKLFQSVRSAANRDLTTFGLKTVIIVWSFIVIALALSTNNKWLLAGILAYEILP